MRRSLLVPIVAGALACTDASAPQPVPPPPPPPPPPSRNSGWEAIDLGLADGQATEGTSINDAGTIVGSVWQFGNGFFSIGGFVYKSGVMRTMQGLAGLYLLEPAAINASEKIVGTAQDGHGGSSLVVWETPDAAPKLLGGMHRVGIAALNDRGDIAVTDEVSPGINYNALLWRDGVSLNLGNLTDTSVDHPSTEANAMNSSGQIVGTSQVAAVRYSNASPDKLMHPFLWENGVMRDLGTLGPYRCTNYGAVSPADCSAGWAAASPLARTTHWRSQSTTCRTTRAERAPSSWCLPTRSGSISTTDDRTSTCATRFVGMLYGICRLVGAAASSRTRRDSSMRW